MGGEEEYVEKRRESPGVRLQTTGSGRGIVRGRVAACCDPLRFSPSWCDWGLRSLRHVGEEGA